MTSTAGTQKTVLIVEDDPDSREMFLELLRGGGYAVVAADNGREAMGFLAVNPPPDAILLDMFMPRMDGWQFRRAQEADPKLAAVPVIVVSAVRAAANSAVRSGAAAFLQKPVAAAGLLDALAKVLEGARPAGTSAPESASAEPAPGESAAPAGGDSRPSPS